MKLVKFNLITIFSFGSMREGWKRKYFFLGWLNLQGFKNLAGLGLAKKMEADSLTVCVASETSEVRCYRHAKKLKDRSLLLKNIIKI